MSNQHCNKEWGLCPFTKPHDEPHICFYEAGHHSSHVCSGCEAQLELDENEVTNLEMPYHD